MGYATTITNETSDLTEAYSKVGLLKDYHTTSEGFIIECNPGGKVLRYAGAALDAKNNAPLRELAEIFQDTVAAVH
jgi:hypothetical protein